MKRLNDEQLQNLSYRHIMRELPMYCDLHQSPCLNL